MRVTRRTWIQLAVFIVVSVTAFMVMAFGYMRLPRLLFGIGHYEVTVELPAAGGLYPRANVTYSGTEVGQVKSVSLTTAGAQAVLSLTTDINIPSDLTAEVHSVSAVGEQYLALSPIDGNSPPLKDGDVVPRDRATLPPTINSLLDATNRGLEAIPHDNLKTVVDEAYTAAGGLGPEISRIVKGSTQLAIDARQNLDALTTVVDQSQPVLNSQTETADSIQAWASHLTIITGQLQTHDSDVRGVLLKSGPAAAEVQELFDRLQPTLPIVLANLVSVGEVAVTYRDSLEQILVLLPQGTASMQAIGTANRNTKQDIKGVLLDFNTNLNLPPPCTTGFLPAQQMRPASLVDSPDRPAGDLYCRVPQDSPFDVRGARNLPCVTRPGKRAPTWQMCESDENYVPLNDGFNWKGDPNATLSGQDIPQQLPPESQAAQHVPAPPLAPIAIAEYDPATGTYVGPDGKVYTQADLAQPPKERTWRSMLTPPTGS